MLGRILIADDSVTIQKVIEMTLASENYELDSCLSEDELFEKLNSTHYDLIVMDFNLSSKRTGLELADEICRVNNETPIMVMLGAFDNIDEESWDRNTICEKIVKPFNSKDFIEKCSRLLKKNEQQDIHEHWNIGGMDKYQESQEKDEEIWDNGNDFLLDGNRLQQEVQEWGVGVPEIIGSDEINTAMESLPAVINEESKPIDDSLLEKLSEEQIDKKSLENNLDINVNEFWSIDREKDVSEISLKEENKNPHFDKNITEEEIRDALKPALEEVVKKYCSQKVEEVAWEVIPDLAENLIRSEIKEISHRLTGNN